MTRSRVRASTTRRRDRVQPGADAGTGQVGTIAAFGAFLAFLFLTVHLLVGLYATSTVTAAAHDGARLVAGARVNHGDPHAVARARGDAEAHVRGLLGRVGARTTFDWSQSTDDMVALRVRVPWPRLLPPFSSSLRNAEVDRTVHARVERPR